jgi:murein DD-endopeptidase MepM/ murein hydrolase activator NlpD
MPIFPLRYRSHASYHDAPRSFGYTRQNSVRSHPGVDLYAPAGLEILAMADGVVVDAPRHFNCGTEAVEIGHVFGTVRYCEIQPGSPLKRGDRVREGQIIGRVGHLKDVSVAADMLHLELYAGTEIGPLTDFKNPPFERRKDLQDPTEFLDSLLLVTAPGASNDVCFAAFSERPASAAPLQY